MNHLEISKALALAIGWKKILPTPENDRLTHCWVWTGSAWRIFNYRDWNVVGPIAERYDCFPLSDIDSGWFSHLPNTPVRIAVADTPQKAIALAVIQGVKV